MATKKDIALRQGRTGIVSVVVSGVADWTGITAKLFAALKKGGEVVLELDGGVSEIDDTITFPYVNSDTVELEQTSYYYEVALFKTDGTYIKDAVYGTLTIVGTVKPNPIA